MELDFYKLHLCGNDLILFNFLNKKLPPESLLVRLSRRICKRSSGIGANGVIILSQNQKHTVMLNYFNHRGTENISYDAYLCAAKFIFDYGIEGSQILSFKTKKEIISVEALDSLTFRISPGIPEIEKEKQLGINNKLYLFTAVSFQNQGASFFFLDGSRGEKEDIANTLQTEIRTVFTKVFSEEEIEMDPFLKRSVKDMAFAAAVSGTAAVVNKYCDNDIIVNGKNGKFVFQWHGGDSPVYITGKPEYIFRGTYYYDESNT